jgi:hypothetical protein
MNSQPETKYVTKPKGITPKGGITLIKFRSLMVVMQAIVKQDSAILHERDVYAKIAPYFNIELTFRQFVLRCYNHRHNAKELRNRLSHIKDILFERKYRLATSGGLNIHALRFFVWECKVRFMYHIHH